MAVKNVAAKSWSITPSFDNKRWSAYPSGNKPQGYQSAPTILYTDVVDGPITGGINNNGLPIRLFGYGFGNGSAMGTTPGAKVYFRDPLGANTWLECAYYWYITTAKVFDRLQVVEMCIEPGALGGSMVNGRALDIKVTVNSVDSNIITGGFTIQPGNFAYVDHDNGVDATGTYNDKTKPFKNLQVYVSGSTYTGLCNSANFTAGVVVLCKGTSTSQLGFDGREFRHRHFSGTAPNGSASNGYIKFLNWPTAGGPSTWAFNDPPGGAGSIQGVNSAYYNLFGKYFVVSGREMACNATSVSDSGPIAFQTGAMFWRVVNCKCGPWPSTTTGGADARSGGFSGQSEDTKILGCLVDSIGGDPAQLQNHGVYIGDSAGHCTKRLEIGYTVITNSTGGSSIQCNNTAAADTFDNITTHHCYIETCAKYNINLSNTVLSWSVWNCFISGPLLNVVRVGTAQTSCAFDFVHNTALQAVSSNGSEGGAILGSNSISSGAYRVRHNIFVREGNGGAVGVIYANTPGTAWTYSENLYWDVLGVLSPLAADTLAVSGDPKFTNRTTRDLTLLTGSPALDACTQAEVIAVPSDIYGIARPVTGTGAPGGTKNDIGATEGIGT